MEDYTAQLYWDYNKPLIRIPIHQPGIMESKRVLFSSFRTSNYPNLEVGQINAT